MKNTISLIFLGWLTLPVAAHKGGPVVVEQARIKLVPASSPATAAFMVMRNESDKDVRLIHARSALARNVELHTMNMVSGKMAMRPVKDILIAARGSVQLKPGGLHIMLIGLKKPLKAGDVHEIWLEFDSGQTQTIKATVES
ncbi:MAG: copper chaperone PCu(A)C [Spirochaetales bacterium]|nr:copper chaperone PCu(A)C [Spirochaetales bacterium]